MQIQIDTKEIRKLLKKGQSTLKNLSPIMRDVAQLMRVSVEKNFEAEGRDKTGATHTWAPLAKSTQKRRAKYKGEANKAHPILEMTGRLKQSINTAHGRDYAQVYTGVRYGVYHQTGTRKMPARPFMLIPRAELRGIEKFIASKIEEALK
ncbi:MAG: phage virion morphogenesis protein [Candidatus Hecatellales archaeon]|nr:MAG: phage virion morphogenesis protein [Candidatus Hecatellales archaeon]